MHWLVDHALASLCCRLSVEGSREGKQEIREGKQGELKMRIILIRMGPESELDSSKWPVLEPSSPCLLDHEVGASDLWLVDWPLLP